MHLLVAIDDNVEEWRAALTPSLEGPRLPLPYAFGAAFIRRGHEVSAIRTARGAPATPSPTPFKAIHARTELSAALRAVDLASLWGGHGIRAVFHQGLLPRTRRRVILNAYAWHGSGAGATRSGLAARLVAPFARALVVMTGEQAERARASLPRRTPVIHFRCGIDTRFYRGETGFADCPPEHAAVVSRLLERPYIVMMGDQLRFEQDALQLIEHSTLTLVRVAQSKNPEHRAWLLGEIRRRGIAERFVVLERIGYRLLRLLLRHARAYAGLVDSSWQPAGWTAACEALAAGTPIVTYDGLVPREMVRLGASERILRRVPPNDLAGVHTALESFAGGRHRHENAAQEAAAFAASTLDCEPAADAFVDDVEGLL